MTKTILGARKEATLVGDDGKPVRWDHNPIAGCRTTFIILDSPNDPKLMMMEEWIFSIAMVCISGYFGALIGYAIFKTFLY